MLHYELNKSSFHQLLQTEQRSNSVLKDWCLCFKAEGENTSALEEQKGSDTFFTSLLWQSFCSCFTHKRLKTAPLHVKCLNNVCCGGNTVYSESELN